MDLTDEALVENFRLTKDPAVFKTLIRRYQSRLYNVSVRILGNAEEAEEVVQDTCLRIHQNLDKFKKGSAFGSWAFRIAHNACLDVLRTKQRRRGLGLMVFDKRNPDLEDEQALLEQTADQRLGPEDSLDLSEQNEYILASLKKLPDNQRAVVVLHDIEGFSYQEIADIVGASLGTVRSRLHYGRLRLKELLEPYFALRSTTPAPR